MTFLIRPGSPFHARQIEARAHENWRSAAELVWERWEILTAASREDRPGAFAAYMSALDAEAVAAEVLADSCLDQAA